MCTVSCKLNHLSFQPLPINQFFSQRLETSKGHPSVGAVTVTPAENFVSPLSESSPPGKHLKNKKKKSQCRRTTDWQPHPDPSERSPTLPSSSGLCVRQIENEQQSTVGEVSQPLKVMALARRLAGLDNAVPSLPGSDSWLSKKKRTKSEACSCTSWCSQATF